MDKVKIGIFGIGHNHAAPAIAALKKCQNAEIVGLCEESDDMYQTRLKENPTVYGDIPRMSKEDLFSSGIEAATVEESVPRLVKTTTECATSGLHVHMDRPAGTDLEEYAKFLSIVKAHNLVFQAGDMYRYIGETERYSGRKMQDVEIIYKFVGAINLPQYGSD